MMLRITAPHFVAGITPGKSAAPILAWMLHKKWGEKEIIDFCKSRRWQVERIPDRKRNAKE